VVRSGRSAARRGESPERPRGDCERTVARDPWLAANRVARPLREVLSGPGLLRLLRLNPDLQLPQLGAVRRHLFKSLPHVAGFRVFVNDVECTAEDVAGDRHPIDAEIPGVGRMTGFYIIATSRQATPGFAVRVRGRIVQDPSLFGLDTRRLRWQLRANIGSDRRIRVKIRMAPPRLARRISWRRHEITFRPLKFVAKPPRNSARGGGLAIRICLRIHWSLADIRRNLPRRAATIRRYRLLLSWMSATSCAAISSGSAGGGSLPVRRPPSGVNLIAFDSRLSRTWRIFRSSPCIGPSRSSSVMCSAMLRRAARSRTRVSALSMAVGRSKFHPACLDL